MDLLHIYNFASHYRTPIYCLLDKEFGGDFVVGDTKTDVKEIDFRIITHKVSKFRCLSFLGATYMVGKPALIRKHYDTYILGADIRDISTWFFLFRKFLFHRHKRVYLWGHGLLGKESIIKGFLYKSFYHMADGGFVYNERSVKLMIEKGISSKKLHTIYNSLDYDKQLSLRQSLQASSIFFEHFGNTYKNVVFIGRLTKVKRFDLLIDAIVLLKGSGDFINVTFIGDGVERVNLEQLVTTKGIEEQVWFYGASYDERINAELLFNADLCVSPGNIGLTAMHVMMFGCPAITNDDFNHQMPEFEAIKKGITGDFFRAGDASSLADTIHNWFKRHDHERESVRRACYKEIDDKWNPHSQIAIFKSVLIP